MDEEQYREYYNGSVPLDYFIKTSTSREDFVRRYNEHIDPKFKITSITNDKNVLNNLMLKDFKLEYIDE